MKNRYRIISMFLTLVIACGVCVPCSQHRAANIKKTPENIGEISYSEFAEENVKVSKAGVTFVDNELMIVTKEGVEKIRS